MESRGMRAKQSELNGGSSKAFCQNKNVRSLTPTCSYWSSNFFFYRIVFSPTFRSMHLKAFEDFESNAMRLLSDDASRVFYAPLIHHYIFSVGTTLNSFHFPQTRLVLKYRHSQCRLSLKVTDDKQVSFNAFRYNNILMLFFSFVVAF